MKPRIAPHNIDAEMCAIGSMIINPDALTAVANLLEPRHFYFEKHSEIFRAIVDISKDDRPVDMVTIVSLLRERGLDEKVGGLAYLSALIADVPTPEHAREYAVAVLEKFNLRELIRVGKDIARSAYDEVAPPAEILNAAETALSQQRQGHARNEYLSIKELCAAHAKLTDAIYAGTAPPPISTGIYMLDKIAGGLYRQDLDVLAARPSIGKTALGIQIGDAVVQANNRVGLISLEMSARQVLNRVIAQRAEIDIGKFSRAVDQKRFDDRDWRVYVDTMGELRKSGWIIRDDVGGDLANVEAAIRLMAHDGDLPLVIVDYLQLMRAPGNQRREQILTITRSLKQTAKKYNTCILLLSQLNRAMVSDKTRAPRGSDLKESGSIEEDADMILFIHRPGKHEERVEGQEEPDIAKTQVIIDKNRNGETGIFTMRFKGEFTKFMEVTGREDG